MLTQLLSSSSSTLHQQLVNKGLIKQLRVQILPMELSSELRIMLEAKPGIATADIESALDKALQDLFDEGIDQQTIDSTVQRNLMRQLNGLQSVSSIGKLLAEGELLANNPGYFKQQLSWMESTTTEDIKAVANKWLGKGFYQLTMLPHPKDSNVIDNVDRSQVPPGSEMANFEMPEVQTATLANGVKLHFIEKKGLPIAKANLLFNGEAASSKELSLLAQVTSRLSGESGFTASADPHYLTVTVSGFSAQLMSQLNGIVASLQQGKFAEAELSAAKERFSMMQARQDKVNNNPANRAMLSAILADQPKTAIADEKLSNISVEQAAMLMKSVVKAEGMSVLVIGDFELNELTAKLNQSIGSWQVSQPLNPTNSIAIKAMPDIKQANPGAQVILIHDPDAKQTGIKVATLGLPLEDKNHQAFSLVNTAFGGMGTGRLHISLREKKALTYVATSGHREMQGRYVWNASTFVTNKNTLAAIKEMAKEVRDIASIRPITSAELANVKGAAIGKLPSRFESMAAVMMSVTKAVKMGKPYDFDIIQANKLQNVTLEQANQAAKQVIDPSNVVWIIDGNIEQYKQQIKALNLGEIKEW